MQQVCFTTLALPLIFATPGSELAHPLRIKRLALSREDVVALDDEVNDVRGGTPSEVKLRLNECPSL